MRHSAKEGLDEVGGYEAAPVAGVDGMVAKCDEEVGVAHPAGDEGPGHRLTVSMQWASASTVSCAP